MITDDLRTNLVTHAESGECEWYHLAALNCWKQGRFQMIPSRDGRSLYLARFWLSAPRLVDGDGDGDGARLESGDSLLLHYFAQGDDDGALHDHPWSDFTTEIISGGYSERRPPAPWRDHSEPIADRGGSALVRVVGLPFADCDVLRRLVGSPRERRIGCNLHAVENVLPETWTVVQTGPRVRMWGFCPPGRSWLPWAEFLTEKAMGAHA